MPRQYRDLLLIALVAVTFGLLLNLPSLAREGGFFHSSPIDPVRYLPLILGADLAEPTPTGTVEAQKTSAPTATPTATRTPTSTPPGGDTTVGDAVREAQILALINQERGARGLPALGPVAAAKQAALRHSGDMAENDFYGHTGTDGSTPGQRLQAAGYDWWICGETVAVGYGGDPARVVAGWMNSSVHRGILLSTQMEEIGVAYANNPSSSWVHFWTADFGAL